MKCHRGVGCAHDVNAAALDDVCVFGLLLDDIPVEVQVTARHTVSVQEPAGFGIQVYLEPSGNDLLVVLQVHDVALGNDAAFGRPKIDAIRRQVHRSGSDGNVPLGFDETFAQLLLGFRLQGHVILGSRPSAGAKRRRATRKASNVRIQRWQCQVGHKRQKFETPISSSVRWAA